MKQAIKLILYYLGYQLLFSAMVTGLQFLSQLTQQQATTYLSPTQLGWVLLLSSAAMIIHLIRFRYIRLRETFRPVHPVRLLVSIGCIFGGMLVCNSLNTLIKLPDWLENDFIGLAHSVTGVLGISLLAPLLEELLFRGAIIRSLNKGSGYSMKKSILLSALFFGIIHLNPAQVPFAFFMGIIFGWVCWKTGSLIPAILGHVFNNSLAVVELAYLGSEGLLGDADSLSSSLLLIFIALAGLTLMLACGKVLQLNYFTYKDNKNDNN